MLGMNWVDWVVVLTVCLTTAVFAVWWIDQTVNRKNPTPDRNEAAIVFLLDGDDLIDATRTGQEMIDRVEGDTDWQRLDALLRPRFSDLPPSSSAPKDTSALNIQASDTGDPASLTVEWRDGVTRFELHDKHQEDHNASDRHNHVLLQKELDVLRQAMDGAPCPIWQTDPEGDIGWHNFAYRRLLSGSSNADQNRIFDINPKNQISDGKMRTSLSIDGSTKTAWYDVFVSQFAETTTCYAINVDAVVYAESAQRNFVQTLAKTFAELSIGLAIFDRNRQLALFNPALIDLTALPAEFLSARPDLLSFFDRLRDNRMMPEPKNYATWREQIADVVAAAANGRYVETWTLPSGPTYKVSGRPHPDGAVAFLLEDISAEVSLTRRFRSELELGQSLLDAMDDAIVVFSSTGLLTASNATYRNLWGIDPESSFVDMTVLDAIRHFQSRCRATPIFGELRDFVLDCTERAEWEGNIRTKTGVGLICRVHPVTGGATLVRFQKSIPAARPPQLTRAKASEEL